MIISDATVSPTALGLTAREYQVLDYIRSHRPRVVPYDEINQAVFGQFSAAHAARVHVSRIRAKLGDGVIVTVHGFGVRYGLARVVEALPRCVGCGRAIAPYEDEWVCFGCGSSGRRRALDAPDLDVGRAAPAAGSRCGKEWTSDEVAFVMEHKDAMSDEQMGAALNRSPSAVRGFRRTRGLGKKTYVLTRERKR